MKRKYLNSESKNVPMHASEKCLNRIAVFGFVTTLPLFHSLCLTHISSWMVKTNSHRHTKKMTEENGKVVLLNFRFSSHVPFFPIWNWSHRGNANKTMMEHVQTIISDTRLEWGRGTIGRIKHRANIFVFPLRKKNCQCFQILILLFGFSNQVF